MASCEALTTPFLSLPSPAPAPLFAGGSATFDWTAPVLPPQFDHVDHYFQLVDAGSGALSNPILVRLR